MSEEENIDFIKQLKSANEIVDDNLKKQVEEIKKMSNTELRKLIEIASWSYICPIIRYLIETNNDLQKRIDKAIEYIIKEYYREHTIPLENLRLENCTYEPSLVALSILQGKE